MRLFAVAVPALAAGLVVSAAPPAAATTSALQFRRINYNAPGTDTASNVNGEWAVVKNTAATTRCLTGWTVRDAASHVYTFGSFCLGGGKVVYLHTGKGTNTSGNRYWGLGWHVWNNDGDKAYLKNSSGVLMDSCSWGTNGPGYVDC
jgi:hypothetical protein